MKRQLSAASFILATVLCCLISKSCANTTTPPSGGLKDTLPPVLIAINPSNRTTEFPLEGGEIRLRFDEYTVVKDQKQIYVSPPGKRKPIVKSKGKDLVVTLRDTLIENTTYTIDFGNGLADNNEGNIAPRIVYTFSTGTEIDSLYFTGTVYDCQKLTPVKNALVAIYPTVPDSLFSLRDSIWAVSDSIKAYAKSIRPVFDSTETNIDSTLFIPSDSLNHIADSIWKTGYSLFANPDSACILSYPAAAAMTDDWGFFSIRAVKSIPYQMFVFSDEDGNSKYDPGSGTVGFLDTLFTPHKVIQDSIYELKSFDMKDTLLCQARESDLSLYLFTEIYTKQAIKGKGRINKKLGYITFSAQEAQINSFQIMGVDSTKILRQFNASKDSMNFWIASDQHLDDSLMVSIDYLKTDPVSGKLENTHETFSVAMSKEDRAKANTKEGREKAAADTTLNLTVDIKPENVEQDGITFKFDSPVASMVLDSVRLISTNPKNQSDTVAFRWTQDTTDIRIYNLQMEQDYQPGYKYVLEFPAKTFIDIYGRHTNQFTNEFQLPNTDKTGSVTLNVKGVKQRYIIELVNADRTKSFRSFTVTEDCSLYFPYLTAGEYTFRITEDNNGNGQFDTGNIGKRLQPERVILYKLPDGSEKFTLEEQTDIEQDLKL
ncbi:MAG: Ig-like domain-containing protein [Bacteroidales bacterium]|nr:Ig-like domain-containing protein [Bacteroidales bacterium]